MKTFAPEPGDALIHAIESSRQQQGIVSTLLEANLNVRFFDGDQGCSIHEISEKMTRAGLPIPVLNL